MLSPLHYSLLFRGTIPTFGPHPACPSIPEQVSSSNFAVGCRQQIRSSTCTGVSRKKERTVVEENPFFDSMTAYHPPIQTCFSVKGREEKTQR